jgi:ComF family protein
LPEQRSVKHRLSVINETNEGLMHHFIQKCLSGLSALLFPTLCKGCGESLGTSQSVLCRACEIELPKTNFEKIYDNPVEQIFWGRIKLEFATSLFFYRKGELLQTLIHQLKYKQGRAVGIYLGRLAGQMLLREGLCRKFDVIVPVPLHPHKQRIRGYNQSAVIAEGINAITQIPVNTDAIIRTVYTDSQTKRGRYDRWKNVQGIFKVIHPSQLENKHLLVVDDVITTGATLEALCSSLNSIPELHMSVLSIGLAVG